MSLIQVILLGALQGLTEFLPVSSSGHLVIFSSLIGSVTASLYFDISVHAGSLLALITYFRKEILQIIRSLVNLLKTFKLTSETDKLVFYLLIATLPAAAIGFFFDDIIEKLFASPAIAVRMLFITALLLVAAEYLSRKRNHTGPLNPWKAFFIGTFQALALIPGISRSGATISAGMAVGLSREKAARFSFLLAIPALSGAFIFKTIEALKNPPDWLASIIGLLVSFVVSFFAIVILINFVKKHSLTIFAVYCFLVAIIGLFLVS